ncbi:MAG: hypothetical protein KJZ69_19345 [Phycisphaerales bacterium]|nr:hypothetical protein [Phycisphaerales bacterium]
MKEPQQRSPRLDAEIHEVLETMRGACQGFIEAVAAATGGGRAIRRATDLQRALVIPGTLAWQVFRLAHADNLLAAADTVPGMKAVRRLVRAAEQKGVSPRSIETLTDSAERFEDLVREVAGSRRTFNSLLTGFNSEADWKDELHYRRAAFEANSHIWGTQVGTKLVTLVFHPSSEDRADMLAISGAVDVFRIRGDAPIEVCSTAAHSDARRPPPSEAIVSLGHPLASNDITAPGCTLLTKFGTQPLPRVQSRVDERGHLVVELETEDVGHRHAVTAFVAELYRPNVPRYAQEQEPTLGASVFIKAPIRTLIVDLIIAAGTHGPTWPTPRGYVVANPRGAPILFGGILNQHRKRILEHCHVVRLGQGAHVLDTADVPRYPEMFRHVCGQLGWNPDVFHAFRCRVEYPVMPSSVVVGYDLPARPQG